MRWPPAAASDRVGTFSPERLVAFGDETSVITSDGRKYSVNAVDANGAIACALSPNWTQYLAQAFGLVFAQCNPTNVAVTALNYATPGAKVADIKTQVDQHLATGSFGGRDLVTVLAGVNDIVEQYRLFPAQSEDTLVAVVEGRGAALAAQVNRIAQAGGKVLIATAPDISVSPFSGAENAANPGSDRQAVLKRLVDRFNAELRINLINDGTKIGLVFADETVQSMVKTPSSYGLVNVANVACAIAPPACTTLTLVTGRQRRNVVVGRSAVVELVRPAADRCRCRIASAQQPVLMPDQRRFAVAAVGAPLTAASMVVHCTSASSASRAPFALGWLITATST